MQLLSILVLSFIQLLNANNEISLTFVGDAMQHMPQIENAKQKNGAYDYSQCFSLVEDDIKGADYAVVNLECPLGGKPFSGYPCFCAPDEFARQLKKTGFDFFLTANNHCLDRRDAGLKRTLTMLDSMKVAHGGTYRNAADRRKRLPNIVEIKGTKIAFLNYTYGTNGITIQKDVAVDYIDRALMARDIDAARAAGAQLLCVCIHWGIEYKLLPNAEQRSLAAFLEDKGVDLIIGGHPHVIQPIEIRRNAKWNKDILVVYSLGNFISNMSTADTRGGAMVKVTLSIDQSGAKLKKASHKLFFVSKPTQEKPFYQLIPANRDDLIAPANKYAFNQFLKNARGIFEKHNINVSEEK